MILVVWGIVESSFSAFALQTVALTWNPSSDTNAVGYKIHYGTSSQHYTSVLDVSNLTSVTISNLQENTTYYFGATAYDTNTIESMFSNEATYSTPQGEPPTLSIVGDQEIAENATTGPLSLTLSDPDDPAGNLILSAQSSNPNLAPISNIVFGGSGADRTVKITPAINRFGTSTILIIVTDGHSNFATNTLLLTVDEGTPVTGTLTATVSGDGSISPDPTGQTFLVNEPYSLTAIPGPGQVFVGWTGGVVSSNPELDFVMSSNLLVQANFAPGPVDSTAGTYNGLFFEQAEVRNASAGSFTATITSGGTFSGRLSMGKSKLSFSGRLNTSGPTVINLPRKGATALTLTLSSDGHSDELSGLVTDGQWTAKFRGDRATFDAVSNPSPFAGTYTLVIPGQDGSPTSPEGHSYGTLRVDAGGNVRFAGALADGTKVSQGTVISKDGLWPLYVPLYSGGGLLLSWQEFTNQSGLDITGLIDWIKQPDIKSHFYANGFTNECETSGSIFASSTNVVGFTSGSVLLDGGNLPDVVSAFVTIVNNKAADPASKLSVTFSPTTGLFKGKVIDPSSGKPLSFGGAVLQKLNGGYGYSLGTTRSSKTVVEP
jgi:hypothetical protein